MFLFLIYHGILPVPINNYNNTMVCRKSETIYKSIVIWLLNSRMKKKNMTVTRKSKSCKQTQIVSKDIDENELNDMWYAV